MSTPTEIAGAQTTVHAVSTTSARVPERRRLTPNTTRREQVLLGACALSSFCLGWLLWTQLLPTQGAAGFLALWYVSFLLLYFLSTVLTEGRLPAVDKVITVIVMSGAVGLLVPRVFISGFFVVGVIGGMTARFLTEDVAPT